MKAVLLAGGKGTRITEESVFRPKPMIEIGDSPILWHIMKIYSQHGINDFIICCGYKGYIIKEYFANYFLHRSDVTFDMKNNTMHVHQGYAEPWSVTVVDTGLETMTGGRLKRVASYLQNEPFCMTYGDGVSDVNITALLAHHRQHKRLATLTSVQVPGRFGTVEIAEDDAIHTFQEKPLDDGGWINGGFFVLDPKVLNLIDNDETIFEKGPLETLAQQNQLSAYRHHGFWKPMDSLRDKMVLEQMYEQGNAPWVTWETSTSTSSPLASEPGRTFL